MAPICTSTRPISRPNGANIANKTVCANPIDAEASRSVRLDKTLALRDCVIANKHSRFGL